MTSSLWLIKRKTRHVPIHHQNGVNDLEVLCKLTSSNGPYGRIDIGVLGEVPELKLVMPKNVQLMEKDENSFIIVENKKKKKKCRKMSK